MNMNMRTKFALLACSLLVAPCLSAGTGPSNCGQNRDQLQVGSNYRTEGVDPDFGHQPYEFSFAQTVAGLDANIACEIQNRLGFTNLNFAQTEFSDLINSVGRNQNGNDLAMSALSITSDRLQAKSFVNYSDDSLGIVMQTAFIEQFPTFIQNELRNPTTVLATLNEIAGDEERTINVGTVGTNNAEAMSIQNSRQKRIIDNGAKVDGPYENLAAPAYRSVSEALAALGSTAQSEINAIFTDGPTAIALAAANNNAGGDPVEAVPSANTPPGVSVDPTADVPSQGLGIVVSPDCCQLYVDVRQAVQGIIRSGVMAQLRADAGLTTPFSLEDMVDLTPAACANVAPTVNPIFAYWREVFCDVQPVNCAPNAGNNNPPAPAVNAAQ